MRNLALCLKINYTSILNNKTECVHTSLSHLSLACLPNVFLYMYVHVYMCAHMCVYMYVCRSLCVCVYPCMCAGGYALLCVHGHVRVFKHLKYETLVALITFLVLYGFWNLCSA